MDYQKFIESKKTYSLSQKSAFLAFILTLIIPLFGYAYTGRWKKFFILWGTYFITAVVVVFFGAMYFVEDVTMSEEALGGVLYGLYFLVGLPFNIFMAVENSQAISQAKELMHREMYSNQRNSFPDPYQDRGHTSPPQSSAEKLKIQLLQYIKLQSEATIADCVIETGCSGNQVREALGELQREQLVIVSNRSDGAVVYSIL